MCYVISLMRKTYPCIWAKDFTSFRFYLPSSDICLCVKTFTRRYMKYLSRKSNDKTDSKSVDSNLLHCDTALFSHLLE